MEDIPRGEPLEKALHPKRVRYLPAMVAKIPKSENLWSSFDIITSATPSTTDTQNTSPPESASSPQQNHSGSSTSSLDVPDSAPSPALYVECSASSEASTPKKIKWCVSPGVDDSSPKKLRYLTPLSSDRPTYTTLNYGSEEESDEDDEGNIQPLVVPRAAKMLMDDDVEEVTDTYFEIILEWPPQPPQTSISTSTPTSLMPASVKSASPKSCSPTPTSQRSSSPTPTSTRSSSPTPTSPTPASAKTTSPTFGSPKASSPTLALPKPTSPTLASPKPTSPTLASPKPTSPTLASPKPTSKSSTSPTRGSPIPVEPSNKFKFDWRAFPVPQIEPRLRREPFSHKSGPTVSFTNPYDAFVAIWNPEIMQMIVTETNIYAKQLTVAMLENGTIGPSSRITRWQDTNVDELYMYFAIVLAMGMVVKSRVEDYWSSSKDIFSTPGFSTEMGYDRFSLLTKCLHFNNNNNFNPASLSQSQARLFKIKPILDHLNRKFSELYNLSQNLALDESLTMWKGWLDINHFISNKAATVGIKTYEICESRTGYLWRFEVHAGHDTSALQDEPLSAIVPSLVLRLLNGLEHKGHTVWMDNFYNSPALARELKVLGFDCVGTLRTNRQFVPPELASITKTDMIVGQVLGCTSGDVDLILWRDKSLVAFISTYHGLASTKCWDTLKPTVAHDYNICMGGVDRKDQMLAMYPIERKRTRVWYKKLFRRLLNASVLNSQILLKKGSLPHRKFRTVLITDLLMAHGTHPPTPTINTATVHSPARYDLIKPGKTDRLKRKCVVCERRTTTYCKLCAVPMCTFTCYEPYHSKR